MRKGGALVKCEVVELLYFVFVVKSIYIRDSHSFPHFVHRISAGFPRDFHSSVKCERIY